MAPESPTGKEAGIVIPFEALEQNPAVAATLQELQRQLGRDLKAHIPKE